MSKNSDFSKIAEVLRNNESFVVMSHVRPDGDALGCTIAMALCLKQLGKKVKAWNQDGVLDKYRFLPCSDMVEQPSTTPENFDVAIALDTAAFDRLGSCHQGIGKVKTWINIDHHISNNHYGDLAYIDSTAPAAGQILYEFFRSQDLPVTYEMADNLFVALSTDTGSFQYPNTSARSYEIAADLIKTGVNVGELSQKMYESHPRRRIDLLRALLNSLQITCNDRVASFALDINTTKQIGALPEDNEGLIDHIRAIEGIMVAVFFEELEENKVRISMRSKDRRYDVCKICSLFGGGGHALAAGARITGEFSAVRNQVLEAICNEITHQS